MANFRTHLTVAALVSTSVAGWMNGRGVVPASDFVPLAVLGALGGLLPDLDADNSVPTRWLWNTASVSAAVVTFVAFREGLEWISLIVVVLACFAAVRWLVAGLVMRVTRHRGLFHSIPAAISCGALCVWLLLLQFSMATQRALVWGGFLAGGFLLHLILDEIYSVDLVNARVKRSFGTALKWRQTDDGLRSNINYLVLATSLLLCASVWPGAAGLWSAWTSKTVQPVMTQILGE